MQHRDVAPSQSERGSDAEHLLYEAIKFAECTGLAAVRLRASGMAITGTVLARRKLSRCNASLKRSAA
jgi:hypothetical protein